MIARSKPSLAESLREAPEDALVALARDGRGGPDRESRSDSVKVRLVGWSHGAPLGLEPSGLPYC